MIFQRIIMLAIAIFSALVGLLLLDRDEIGVFSTLSSQYPILSVIIAFVFFFFCILSIIYILTGEQKISD